MSGGPASVAVSDPLGSALQFALLGAIPMAVHGYRLLYLGDRLFQPRLRT